VQCAGADIEEPCHRVRQGGHHHLQAGRVAGRDHTQLSRYPLAIRDRLSRSSSTSTKRIPAHSTRCPITPWASLRQSFSTDAFSPRDCRRTHHHQPIHHRVRDLIRSQAGRLGVRCIEKLLRPPDSWTRVGPHDERPAPHAEWQQQTRRPRRHRSTEGGNEGRVRGRGRTLLLVERGTVGFDDRPLGLDSGAAGLQRRPRVSAGLLEGRV
jgi:hypothetical protein